MKLSVAVLALLSACTVLALPKKATQASGNTVMVTAENGLQQWVDLNVRVSTYAVKAENIDLYLYTRKNAEEPHIIKVGNVDAISATTYDPKLPLFIVTHGWMGDNQSDLGIAIRRALLKSLDCNVLVTDWGKYAKNDYLEAIGYVKGVGREIGKYLNNLLQKTGQTTEDVRLIGHSLGAHVSGHIGEQLGGKVKSIAGLDPAAPLIPSDPTGRLDKTDAQFVEVMHTCTFMVGLADPIGHVDYYPNGGSSQPGCGMDLSCSHLRAFEYYAEAVVGNQYTGIRCDSWEQYNAGKCNGNPTAKMGLPYPDTSASGIYFVKVRDVSPYSLG